MLRKKSHTWLAALSTALIAIGVGVIVATPTQAAAGASIFGTMTPSVASDSDSGKVELGVQFKSAQPGQVTGIRFFKGASNTGPHTGALWSGSTKVAAATFTGESESGWQTASFAKPVVITAGKVYTASYLAPKGRYAVDNPYKFPKTTGSLIAVRGVYQYGGGYPTNVYQASNYWVDVVFIPTSAPLATAAPTTKPTPTSTTTVVPTAPTLPPPTATTSVATATSTPPPTVTTTVATATSTPPPSQGNNCAPVPSKCGFPDATNTGAKGTLRKVPSEVSSGPGWNYDSRGWVNVSGNGAILENLDVPYNIDVNGASDVTIRNVKLTQSGESFGVSIRHGVNTLIEDTTIMSAAGSERLLVAIKDIYGDSTGTIIRRVDISAASTGVQIDQGTIEDSYIHDLRLKSGDHINGTTSNGGSTLLTIRHNTVFNSFSQTDAISLFQDFGVQKNRVIDNNLLAGGGYTIYGGANAGKEALATNIQVTNNRISRMYYPQGGSFGWLAAWNQGGEGNMLTGNRWDDTGSLID